MIINRSIKVSGGMEITDGIVVKARDSQHRPTAIEYFGEYVSAQSLGSPNGNVGFGAGLSSATFHGTVYVADEAFYNDANLISITGLFENIGYIGTNAFNGCAALEMEIALPAGVTYGLYPFQNSGIKKISTLSPSAITRAFCLNCNKLVHFSAVNISEIDQRALENCTALAEVTLGSIGHAITTLNASAFSGDTQTGLTITVYTTGAYADTALTNIRNGATNATIILKASEDTTYNDVSYTAGEVMITSRVEISFSILDEETSESLGTFTVNGGTAFAEWIGSGLTLDSGLMLICSGADNSGPVMDAEGIYSLRYGGAAVNGTDAIVSGADYTLHNDYA